jgi:cytochrome c
MAALAVILALLAPAVAVDGAELYRRHGCPLCHGIDGRQPPRDNYPRLAGQNRGYLVRQMLDIRSGARDNAASEMMRVVIEEVSDADLEAIAAYLSRLTAAD